MSSSPTISPTASGLKARLQGIAQVLHAHGDEIHEDHVTIDILKAAKDNGITLNSQVEDFQLTFAADLNALEQDFVTQANMQRAENQKNQQSLNQLKAEKTAIHQQLLAIQRRVEELEEELGQE